MAYSKMKGGMNKMEKIIVDYIARSFDILPDLTVNNSITVGSLTCKPACLNVQFHLDFLSRYIANITLLRISKKM